MPPRPIITLASDFGLGDWYVAAMKAVLLRHCPAVALVDITHEVPPGDVLKGSFLLERALASFDPGTVHLAVVDPGVGSARRILIAQLAGQWVVCPDNGLITWAWRRIGGGTAHEATWRPAQQSNTFHGRDIMAPLAGRLAAGEAIGRLGVPLADPVLLAVAPATGPADARIIYIDHFGNAITNVPEELVRAGSVWANGRELPLKRTYADVAVGETLALIGSSGLLELSVRDGSAAAVLGLKVGDSVSFGGAK